MDNLPSYLKLLDVKYKILYTNVASEVDAEGRESLCSQIDYWTRIIRVLKQDKEKSEVMQHIWHEILHGIGEKLHIPLFQSDDEDDDDMVDEIATVINLVLMENPDIIKQYVTPEIAAEMFHNYNLDPLM